MKHLTQYRKQLNKWAKYMRGVSSDMKKAYPKGFIDQEFDTDKIIGEVLRPNNYALEAQKFVYESAKPSLGKMTFKEFVKKMAYGSLYETDPITGEQTKIKYNPWLNIDNGSTQKRMVKQIKKETALLQARVDFLRSSRERLKDGKEISIKYINDLAKQTGDKKIKDMARRFAREYKGYTPKRLESTYTALTKAIEDDIINLQQKRMVDDVINRTASSPAKRTAQTTLSNMANQDALDAIKKSKGKYVRIVLNPNRTWKGTDVCDHITSDNPTGLGKGVYLIKDARIPPYHAHCGCEVRPFNP